MNLIASNSKKGNAQTGEYYDIDDGLRLFPVYGELESGDFGLARFEIK